jgi:response regulator RpfG family c-di-GMP phosphodiesterase
MDIDFKATILIADGSSDNLVLMKEEFNIMKLHTVQGRDAIAGVEKTLGGTTPFLRYARAITCSHQEKWDGSVIEEQFRAVAAEFPDAG